MIFILMKNFNSAILLPMYKLIPAILLCLLISSCQKVNDNQPDSDYRFEVSCNDCTISIATGNYNTVTYNVRGYESIPYNHTLPAITVSLYTNDYYDDPTLVKFTGSGYNRILFNDDLYYDDPVTVIQFNL